LRRFRPCASTGSPRALTRFTTTPRDIHLLSSAGGDAVNFSMPCTGNQHHLPNRVLGFRSRGMVPDAVPHHRPGRSESETAPLDVLACTSTHHHSPTRHRAHPRRLAHRQRDPCRIPKHCCTQLTRVRPIRIRRIDTASRSNTPRPAKTASTPSNHPRNQ